MREQARERRPALRQSHEVSAEHDRDLEHALARERLSGGSTTSDRGHPHRAPCSEGSRWCAYP
jgi:hypothetical protein